LVSDTAPLRPTKAVVRKALCDILRPVIHDLVVLDLFAGTGQVSRDLLREGARRVFAVDRRAEPGESPECLQWFQQSIRSFLSHGPPEPVGLVFLDPPYQQGRAREILRILEGTAWIKQQGLIAVETDQETNLQSFANRSKSFTLKRNRRYGGTRLWIFQEQSVDGEDPG